MKLNEIVQQLELKMVAGKADDSEVTGGYVCDLLSDVIANCQKGQLWITLQIHQNILAVATLKELAGIVVIGGKEPAEATVEKARAENIPLLTSSLPAYELAGRLYALGVH